MTRNVLLMILDGWGIGDGSKSDAIRAGHPVFIEELTRSNPHAALRTDGENVGLPEGQMGNSEVGHLNIGAGRVVYQDLVKINRACRAQDSEDHSLAQNTEIRALIDHVITDADTRYKYAINDFPLIPRYAVLDPKVTLSLPPFITATTGMDALTHAVEAYIGNSTTIDTRRDALKAVKLIFENIDIAYEHGDNIQARRNMLHASFYAGCAFTKSYVGYVHAVAHSLGGQYNVPHGLANAILLPLVLREYGSCIDKKLHRLAIAAGLADKKTPDHEAAELFIRSIEEMKERFGIVNIVKEIQETDIPKLAHYADKEANPLYPVPKLMDASELEKFYYMLMSLTSKENTSEAEK